MRIAYVLVVHSRPGQVVRLVHRLATDGAHFVLHVDKRAGDDVYADIARGLDDLPSVTFVERHACYWGGFGMVRATLACLRHLVANDVPFDYAVLLSGQDYPLRTAAAIEQFYDDADGRSFVNHFALPRTDGWGQAGGLDRIERWHLVRRRALHLRLPRPRRLPDGLRPFGGSAWWSLSRPVVEYVDRYVRDAPHVLRFFEHVLHPDEVMYQTIVMNSPHAGTVVDASLRYVRWANDDRSPVTLRAADVDELLASGRLFARKFDAAVDAHVLDLLDGRLGLVAA